MQAANTGDGNDILNLFSIDNDIPSTYTFYEPISVFVYFHPVVDCREICLAINFKIWHFWGLISTSALAVERQTRLGNWNVRIRRTMRHQVIKMLTHLVTMKQILWTSMWIFTTDLWLRRILKQHLYIFDSMHLFLEYMDGPHKACVSKGKQSQHRHDNDSTRRGIRWREFLTTLDQSLSQ